jgi:hypothetical protein
VDTYFCSFCPRSFANLGDAFRHVQSSHPDVTGAPQEHDINDLHDGGEQSGDHRLILPAT